MTAKPDKRMLCLLSNGDIPAWSTQALYEQAWKEGIRPLNECALKPDLLTRRKKRRVGGASIGSIGMTIELMGRPSRVSMRAAR